MKIGETMKKNKLTILDSLLSVVCIVISMEAITPTAASGNSQFFYWAVILVLFFIPYSLVNAELGSSYPSEFGMYSWAKKAFGKKTAYRVSWYYWINYPIWMLSFAILFTELFGVLFGITLGIIPTIIIEVLFVIGCCYLSTKRVNKLDDMIDIGAIFKLVLLVGIIILGAISLFNFGSATDFSLNTFKPDFNYVSITIIALLLYNFTGVEIVTTFSKDMKNLKRDLPRTILYSCIIIIIFYILPILSVKVAIPSVDLNSSTGFIDSYRVLLSNVGLNDLIINAIIFMITIMFMYILFAIIVSWAFGVNSVVRKAALEYKAPKIFTKENDDNVPTGIPLINALIAIVLCLLINLSPGLGNDVFMTVFSTSVIIYLCSYLPLFAIFYKLRITSDVERPYKVPGNKLFLIILCIIPTLILIAGVFFLLVPELNLSMLDYQLPIIITFIIIVIIGELIVCLKNYKK